MGLWSELVLVLVGDVGQPAPAPALTSTSSVLGNNTNNRSNNPGAQYCRPPAICPSLISHPPPTWFPGRKRPIGSYGRRIPYPPCRRGVRTIGVDINRGWQDSEF